MSEQANQFEAVGTQMNGIEEERIERVLPNIYFWGSAECDQYDIKDEDGEDQPESERPYKLNYFATHQLNVVRIACGGLHSLFLTDLGKVYSCGCNDVSALGAVDPSISDRVPRLVEIEVGVDMISAGDSHSVAVNSESALVYFWGVYKNTNGNMQKPFDKPTRVGESIFNKPVLKLLSGYNHTMILMDKRVYCWGDQDTKVLGRKSNTRNSIQCSLQPEAIGVKNVIDVFTGGYHSFVKVEKKIKQESQLAYYAWGLNNYGQLGIGSTGDSLVPTEIVSFRGHDIVDIVGGEHHSVALHANGSVYTFGRNDDGQLGQGEEVNEALKVQALEQKQKTLATLKTKQQHVHQTKRVKNQNQQQIELLETTDRVFGYEYVTAPEIVKGINPVNTIQAAGHYSYAYNLQTQEFYSWGMGTSYVLGTRKEESVFKPYLIPPQFFRRERVLQLSLGGQSVGLVTAPDAGFQLSILSKEALKVSQELRIARLKAFRKVIQSREQSQPAEKGEYRPQFSGSKRQMKSDILDEPVQKLKID